MDSSTRELAHEMNSILAIIREEAGWIEDILGRKDMQKLANHGELSRSLSELIRQTHRCKEIVAELRTYPSADKVPRQIRHDLNNPIAVIGEEAGWMEDLLGKEDSKKIADHDELTNSLSEIKRQAGRCRETAQYIGTAPGESG